MSGRLRSVNQETPFYNTTISSSIASSWIKLGDLEGPFSIHFIWENGNSPVMAVELQVSNDKIHYETYAGSSQAISGASGSYFYDLAESGAQFIRVSITVTSGDAKVSALFNGKARV